MPDNNMNDNPHNQSMAGGQAQGAAASAKSSRKTGLIIAIVIVAIAIVAIAVMAILGVMSPGSSTQYDATAESGQAPYKTEEEMQAELDRTVDEGMLNISIASEIKFPNGEGEGTAYIENVPSNRYDLSVAITLDDDDDASDDEVIYESGILKPNNYIEKIKLNRVLPAGEYPATATFTAYDPDTQEKVGQAAAKITLVIES